MTPTFIPSLASVATTLAVLGGAGLFFTFLQQYILGTWLGEFSLIGAGVGTVLLLSGIEHLAARLATKSDTER